MLRIYHYFTCDFHYYGTEIWPQEIRAKGYSSTILGWAVGCGMNTFVISIMLDRLGWMTFIVFSIFNILAMPVIWLIYPEVAGKALKRSVSFRI
jgi:hypothetical protein